MKGMRGKGRIEGKEDRRSGIYRRWVREGT
jgi:hypothetical protein